MAEWVVRETEELVFSSIFTIIVLFKIMVHDFVIKDNVKYNDMQDTFLKTILSRCERHIKSCSYLMHTLWWVWG